MDQTAFSNRPVEGIPGRCQESVVQKFTLNVEYPVVFTRDIFKSCNRTLAQILLRDAKPGRRRIAVYIDKGVVDADPAVLQRIQDYFQKCGQDLQLTGPIQIVPGGEAIKNSPRMIDKLYQQFLELCLDRHSYVLTIGGGSVLDLVGFAAATFHRGIRHVRVPTTVLAQNDAGIGVKTGRNFCGVKNLVGSFQPPWGVIIDGSFLDTLPDREKRAGLSEAVKVALIRDRRFYEWIQNNATVLARFETGALHRLIRNCALLHLQHIVEGGDPFENGNARPLDFGHWSAHKLEVLSGHDLRHGEAVAIGIALDARYSVLAGHLADPDDSRIAGLLRRLGFSLWHPVLEQRDGRGRLLLLQGLREFREHLGGELSITLLKEIGWGVEKGHIDTRIMSEAVAWLHSRHIEHTGQPDRRQEKKQHRDTVRPSLNTRDIKRIEDGNSQDEHFDRGLQLRGPGPDQGPEQRRPGQQSEKEQEIESIELEQALRRQREERQIEQDDSQGGCAKQPPGIAPGLIAADPGQEEDIAEAQQWQEQLPSQGRKEKRHAED
ncbi:MAG: 3-dehydroquinate synthase [Syntrophotaleaceae bacterium]